jgi:hypothetical protein
MKKNFKNDRRLIEDYLPIKAISKEASSGKWCQVLTFDISYGFM